MIDFRPLITLEIQVEAPLSLGATAAGERRVIPFVGGHFSGSDMQGRVLPGGTDWQQLAPDGSLEIRAHYLLETDAGERIEVRSEGVRTGTPEVLARLAKGELLPASAYYFRTAIRLHTAAARLSRLNSALFCSVGERRPTSVLLSVYELL
jgi:Protein of unknown function (DUF3237)